MYWNYGIAVEQIGLIGAEALNYESVVRMQLAWIDATDVGKLLFRAIARNRIACLCFTGGHVRPSKWAKLQYRSGPIQTSEITRRIT